MRPDGHLGAVRFLDLERGSRCLLSSSDVEPYTLAEALALADTETRALWDALSLGYTEPAGHPLLRSEIARVYEDVDADDVLVTAGADEALFLLARSCLRAGDHAVVVSPAYDGLVSSMRSSGADVTLHELDPSEDWALDVDRLRRELRGSTRLVVVNAPHNPTGALPDRATFRALCELVEEAGARLLCDEVYRFLELDPTSRLPAAADASRAGISLGVMSKAFALAGLRIGWIATRDREVLRRAAAAKSETSVCNSAPSEILALAALRARETVLARSRGIIGLNIALLDRFFERWRGVFDWVRPHAGTVGFPRFHGDLGRLADDLYLQERVLLLPGSLYGGAPDRFRIGLGRRDLPDGLAALERVAEERRAA